MAKTISIVNMKGGVGKTTLTVNIGYLLAAMNSYKERVLIVDLDPQFNASQYLLGADRLKEIITKSLPTVIDVFEKFNPKSNPKVDLKKSIRRISTFSNSDYYGRCVDLIPSQLELSYTMKNPTSKETLLKQFLDTIQSDYDTILIDCPPTESILTESAYHASDYVLVPVRPEFLPVIGMPLLLRSVKEYNLKFGRDLKIIGIVLNAVSDYNPEEIISIAEITEFASQNNIRLFENRIRNSKSFPRSAREAETIFNTPRARQTVKQNLQEFVKELKTALV